MTSSAMMVIFYAVAALELISAVITGVEMRSLRVFVQDLLSAAPLLIMIYTLVTILRNQEDILQSMPVQLEKFEKRLRRYISQGDSVCSKCGQSHDPSYAYCPHCGNRDSAPSVPWGRQLSGED
jgi:hydrogenase maturation factor HypF (carbamoyltransferase family)